MDSIIDKYIHLLVSLIISLVIFNYSDFNFTYKIVFIIITFFINKYFTTSLYRNIKNRIKLMKLEELEYFSINPTLEFFIHIVTGILGYGLWILIGLFRYEMKINFKNPMVLLFLFFLFYFIVLRRFGPAAQVTKSGNTTVYSLRNTGLSGFGKSGRRFGTYKDGIVVDKYIFTYHEIHHPEIRDNRLILRAGQNDIINIYDKKAIIYFKEIFAIM